MTTVRTGGFASLTRSPQLIREDLGVGEDEWGIEAVDEQSGKIMCIPYRAGVA